MLVAVLLLTACATAPSAQSGAIARAHELGATLHLLAVDAQDATTVSALNPEILFLPASALKLLTAATALRHAPQDFSLNTCLLQNTAAKDATELLLVAAGDPLLTTAELDSLATQAAARVGNPPHIRLRLDAHVFSGGPWGRGWMWDDDPDAMRVVPLRLRTDTSSEPVRRALDALAAALQRTTGARVSTAPPLATQETEAAVASVTAPLLEVATVRRKLSELLQEMLLHSDNMAAECVLRLLPTLAGRESQTAEGGLALISEEIARCGVAADRLVLADGSGLSRYNLLDAAAITQVLRVHEQEHPGRLRSLLPRAGESGTLRKRMVSSAAVGRVQAKTGSLEGLSVLAGCLTTVSGRELIFCLSVQQSAAKAATLRALLDDAVLALVEERW